MTEKINLENFMTKLLNGVAIGIIIGLIPNAILGEIFKALSGKYEIFKTLTLAVTVVQFAVPALVGALVSYQFKLNPIETATVTMTTFLGSMSIKSVEKGFMIAGIGDLINTIIVVALAVLLVSFLRGKLGNLNLILLPILTVCIVGTIGILISPYVARITSYIGLFIKNMTGIQPLLMSIIISICFSLIIISPISTVAIALAVGLDGLASGAANLGIVATCVSLVVGSIYANKSGVTLAVLLGSPKMFLPNWVKHPIINIPIILLAIVNGIVAYLFNIQGTAQSAGFGFSGLVGPINAYRFLQGTAVNRVLILLIAFFVIPFVVSFVIDYILVKIIKVYKHDVYKFEG